MKPRPPFAALDQLARHAAAMLNPRPGFESAIVGLVRALEEYADAHREAYSSSVGEDGVLGDHWLAIARNVRGLLNGESGRLDCGTVDGAIRDLAMAQGFKEGEIDG